MNKLKSSGVGDLKAPRTDHTPVPGRPLPAADEGVIRAGASEAVSGVDAGASGQDAGTAPSNGVLGDYRDLIAPSNYHVP